MAVLKLPHKLYKSMSNEHVRVRFCVKRGEEGLQYPFDHPMDWPNDAFDLSNVKSITNCG